MQVPVELRTSRLLLRPWRAEDAPALHPLLVANQAHIAPWIPARVADPATVLVLEQRLAGFGADFAAAREWRYGMFLPDGGLVLGEFAMFPRSATARVAYAEADRVELGYWLREDMTGRGLVTEAARAVLAVAATLERVSLAEIHCDQRNLASAAVPRRLGFVLASTIEEPPAKPEEPAVQLQIWTSEVSPFRAAPERRADA